MQCKPLDTQIDSLLEQKPGDALVYRNMLSNFRVLSLQTLVEHDESTFFYIKRRQITASCSATFMKETWSWTGHVLSPVFMRGHCVPREWTSTNLDDVSHPPPQTHYPVLILWALSSSSSSLYDYTPKQQLQILHSNAFMIKNKIPTCFTLLMLLLFNTDDTDVHHMLSCFRVFTQGFW